MNERSGPSNRSTTVRVQLPLLDRLIDDAPDQAHDAPISNADSITVLRNSVRRDLEALLNARRRWRSWPSHLTELGVSPVGYGIPDFTSGAFNDPQRRDELRHEIESTIRRFEPRFRSVRVHLIDTRERLEATLRLRIDGVLRTEPVPEAVSFDTLVDPTTDQVLVRQSSLV